MGDEVGRGTGIAPSGDRLLFLSRQSGGVPMEEGLALAAVWARDRAQVFAVATVLCHGNVSHIRHTYVTRTPHILQHIRQHICPNVSCDTHISEAGAGS